MKYEILNCFPNWKGFGYKEAKGYEFYAWFFYVGFWQITKWEKANT